MADDPKPAPNEEYPFPFRRLEVSQEALSEINSLLDWHAGTVLDGRMLGHPGATANKRTKPGLVPDRRITALHNLIGLTGKSVLEVGCFEGIHTLGLRLYSDNVTAVDVRPSNVMKTLARLSLHGTDAKVFIADAEEISVEFGQFDVIVHCGVLYHLMSPVEHIFSVAGMCRYLLLDTHVASEQPAPVKGVFEQFAYQGTYHDEGGWRDPFSGRHPKSLWLTEESLLEALQRAGFQSINLLERRAERNGPRVTILASR